MFWGIISVDVCDLYELKGLGVTKISCENDLVLVCDLLIKKIGLFQ